MFIESLRDLYPAFAQRGNSLCIPHHGHHCIVMVCGNHSTISASIWQRFSASHENGGWYRIDDPEKAGNKSNWKSITLVETVGILPLNLYTRLWGAILDKYLPSIREFCEITNDKGSTSNIFWLILCSQWSSRTSDALCNHFLRSSSGVLCWWCGLRWW